MHRGAADTSGATACRSVLVTRRHVDLLRTNSSLCPR